MKIWLADTQQVAEIHLYGKRDYSKVLEKFLESFDADYMPFRDGFIWEMLRDEFERFESLACDNAELFNAGDDESWYWGYVPEGEYLSVPSTIYGSADE